MRAARRPRVLLEVSAGALRAAIELSCAKAYAMAGLVESGTGQVENSAELGLLEGGSQMSGTGEWAGLRGSFAGS